MPFSKSILTASFVISISCLYFGEGNSAEINLSLGKIEKVTENRSYFYSIRSYSPVLSVPKQHKNQGNPYEKIEYAALAHFGSMLAGDYPVWLKLWDESSRKLILKQNITENRDAKFWEDRWIKGLSPYSKFELIRRVDSGLLRIIEFRASAVDPNVEPLFLDIPLIKNEKGEWRPTLMFAEDPVLQHWRRPGYSFEKAIRMPPEIINK